MSCKIRESPGLRALTIRSPLFHESRIFSQSSALENVKKRLALYLIPGYRRSSHEFYSRDISRTDIENFLIGREKRSENAAV